MSNPSFSQSDPSTSFQTSNAGLIDQSKTAEQENSALDTEQDKMFDFSSARIHLQRIVEDWHTEVEDTEVRRKTRDVEIDTEGLRQKGDLDEDETIIPVRVIDTNIQRELPAYINYLKNSRRLCTFRSLDNPKQDPQLIEKEFTRGMTYCGWEKPHYKELDGSSAHGWAAIEVVYDESKPLNVGIEYLAHDKLFWPRTSENIQDAPRIIRAYDVSIMKLKEWVRSFDFDGKQVELLIQARRDQQKENETIRIYKLFFKKEGIVFVSWFALTDSLSDWLKKPVKHYVGIDEQSENPQMPGMQSSGPQYNPSDLRQYPIFKLPYRETEKGKEVDNKGRCYYDEAKQEAQTAILSGFVNGLTRASNVYASPAAEDGTGSSLKEIEDVKLSGGRILSKPMIFWSPPYPDALIIRTLEYMDNANSEETNQVNFASMNREDSRKTAKEIGSAEKQQQLLNSVQLTLYSTHIREVYSFSWLIVQSQAIQSKISFLLIEKQRPSMQPQIGIGGQMQMVPVMDQSTGQPQMESYFENDFDTIKQIWEVRAAGDVDVIQRQEKIGQMLQMWPIIANTPLANRFLADLVRIMFPDDGDQYAEILTQQNPVQVVAAMTNIMGSMLQQHPEIQKSLPPDQQNQLAQLLQTGAQMGAQLQQQQGKSQQKNTQ